MKRTKQESSTRSFRILCFSDWRSQRIADVFAFIEKFKQRTGKDIDLIIYAGDDVDRFQEGNKNYFSELAALTTQKKLLAVMGNDESPVYKNILSAPGVIDLHEKSFKLGKYVFIGQEGSTKGPAIIHYEEETVEKHLRSKLSRAPTILVSHTPPHGILDISVRFGTDRIGSTAVRTLVDEGRFKMVICGHSHMNGGRCYTNQSCTIVNVASHDDKNAEGNFCVFELGQPITDDCFFTTDYLIDDSPLLKLQQLGRNRLQQFHAAGITGFDQINEQNRALLKTLPGVGDYHVDLWIRQITAIRTNVPIREKEKALLLIGKDYILYDIETDLENKTVFMIGCYVSSTGEFKQFFEKKNQKKLLKEFIKYIDRFPKHSLVSFSNCYFERRVLTDVCERELLRTTRFSSEIDLGIPISGLLIGDYRGYSVKTLAEDLGFSRQSTLDGFQVGQQYTEYLLGGQDPDWNAIVAYNKEDVLQLKRIIDFLLQ